MIVFECLYGFTPFCRQDRQMTKLAISKHHETFQFPPEAHTKNHRVSDAAKHFIFQLIQEPELRLSSRQYLQNDYVAVGEKHWMHADRESRNYAGNYVYANDAADIKAHPFFEQVPWNHVHAMQPPWVPSFKQGDSITRWFESEEEILGSEMEVHAAAAGRALDGRGSPTAIQHQHAVCEPARRARDKLLRDPLTADAALAERKKSAFLGYTYRRPRTHELEQAVRASGPLPVSFGY